MSVITTVFSLPVHSYSIHFFLPFFCLFLSFLSFFNLVSFTYFFAFQCSRNRDTRRTLSVTLRRATSSLTDASCLAATAPSKREISSASGTCGLFDAAGTLLLEQRFVPLFFFSYFYFFVRFSFAPLFSFHPKTGATLMRRASLSIRTTT